MLIISYYWPPSGGPGVQRWLKFVKYLPEFNIEPILFIPKNANYPLLDKSLSDDVNKDLKVIQFPITEISGFLPKFKFLNSVRSGNISKPHNQSLLQKLIFFIRGNLFIPDMKIFWKSSSVNFLSDYLPKNNIDTIITTGPPHSVHLIGLELKRKLNINWISDFRDPWVKLNYLNRFHLLPFSRKSHISLRNKVLINSNAVIVTSERLKDLFSNITSNIYKITNGFDYIIKENNLDNKFSISHIGSLYPERNPKFLWDSLEELFEGSFKKDLQINFIGNTSEKIKKELSKRKFHNHVRFYDYVDYNRALELMCSSQALLMIEVNDEESSYAIPGKLFDYLNSKRPIISIGPNISEVSEILNNTNSGKFFNYHDKRNLKLYINQLYKSYKNGTNIISDKSKIDMFKRINLTKKLSEVIVTVDKKS